MSELVQVDTLIRVDYVKRGFVLSIQDLPVPTILIVSILIPREKLPKTENVFAELTQVSPQTLYFSNHPGSYSYCPLETGDS